MNKNINFIEILNLEYENHLISFNSSKSLTRNETENNLIFVLELLIYLSLNQPINEITF